VVSNPQTGASDYFRIVKIGKQNDYRKITSNFQNVQIPTSNTVLGMLMRNSILEDAERPERYRCLSTLLVQDFASSSSYVSCIL